METLKDLDKAFYKSRTFWYNGLTIVLVLATYAGYVPNESLTLQVKGLLVALAPLVNLLLRLKNQ